MKKIISIVTILLVIGQISFGQSSKDEKTVLQLSKDKWQWMADKDVDKLAELFDDKAKFVHMSGTWKKDEELEIIKTGSIWYKKATIHDSAIELSGKTAIVWNRITLESIVRGSDAKVEFTVTEVYQKQGKHWKMLALTFSSVRDTHQIKK
ncbi:MAG: nuclear transport factor 2 family protein [Flectobacillus sp.]|nr:nuclear transport factor 2 family protein [Flectobacillus sp.]